MSEAKESATTDDTYELVCTDCEFTTTVDGSIYDALDTAEAHQDEYGTLSMDHFVNVELRSEPE
jgi:hypothetical protein